ncbi:MAG: hypothetical protein Ct9H300mP25_15790 [Acidobacteriota bacterium]|nr:MAG: hypothetical protein Ct9H300mP25_15790 [Acidobacteriota bacterium]
MVRAADQPLAINAILPQYQLAVYDRRQVNNTHEVHATGLRFDRRCHRMESGLCMALDTKNTQVSVCGN